MLIVHLIAVGIDQNLLELFPQELISVCIENALELYPNNDVFMVSLIFYFRKISVKKMRI